MKVHEIQNMPTVTDLVEGINCKCKIHESCLRSFHIVEKVKHYLEHEVHPKIILELIHEMQHSLRVDWTDVKVQK